MQRRNIQLKLLENEPKSYGGELLRTRRGRSRPRPIDTKNTMHLVLRSSKANGDWSFWRPMNKAKIQLISRKFSSKYGVKILSMANVGNHLHYHVKVSNRFTYKAFIRALTGAITMAVSGASRWKPLEKSKIGHFWDYRPFTRVVVGRGAFLNLKNYIKINELEGYGFRRLQARFFVKWNELKLAENSS